jgi:tetratricopeptide (TPR) repeat protein
MKTIITFILLWLFTDPAGMMPRPTDQRIVGTTENPEARKDFERALLLLHNFEYPDAAELFRQAQQKDPAFALAYWGEAMTYNHPVWLSQDATSARAVLKRYRDVSDSSGRQKLPSLDRDLLKSLEFLYGDAPKRVRDKNYADHMATLYERYSGNQDVAAFYALSLLGLAGGWDQQLCSRAANISRSILKENPKHPGALHYYIHAEDHPEFARLAWDQANEYARVASYSGHALHMPSHIYLALGLWDDVVRSNEVSWRAGVDRKESRKLNNDALNYHGHWWLEYGYLQQGRFDKAREILGNQLAFMRALPSPVSRTHFILMRGHYLVETNHWLDEVAREEVILQDLRIEIRSLDRFITGLGAYRNRDETALKKVIAEIEKDLSQSRQMKVMNDGIAQCMPGPNAQGVPSESGINQASILNEELKGLFALLRADVPTANAHFQKAVDLEEVNGHFFGPPEIMKPTNEFFGEFLLAIGRPKEAVTSFEQALQKTPGRNHSLVGLVQASQTLGDHEKETKATRTLSANLRNGDGEAPSGFIKLP